MRDQGGRVPVLVAADQVLREVEPRAREPLGARHRPRAEHALVGRVGADLEVRPDRRPETLEVGDRPAPERVVVGEVEPALVEQPREVTADFRPLAHVGRRLPEDLPPGRCRRHGTSTARPVTSPSRSRPSTSLISSSGCVSVRSTISPRPCSCRISQRSIQLPTRLPWIARSCATSATDGKVTVPPYPTDEYRPPRLSIARPAPCVSSVPTQSSTTSTPAPPVTSRTAPATSSCSPRTSSAPSSRARFRRRSSVSIATTAPAPSTRTS